MTTKPKKPKATEQRMTITTYGTPNFEKAAQVLAPLLNKMWHEQQQVKNAKG
jgi:hypothetical protein